MDSAAFWIQLAATMAVLSNDDTLVRELHRRALDLIPEDQRDSFSYSQLSFPSRDIHYFISILERESVSIGDLELIDVLKTYSIRLS